MTVLREQPIHVFGSFYPNLESACNDFGIDQRIVVNRLRKHRKPSAADINQAFVIVRMPRIIVNGICFRSIDAACDYFNVSKDELQKQLPQKPLLYRGKSYPTVKDVAEELELNAEELESRLKRLGHNSSSRRIERCINTMIKEKRSAQPFTLANQEYPSLHAAARYLRMSSDRLYERLTDVFGDHWPSNPSMAEVFPDE